MEELNKDVMMKDLENILQHLQKINDELKEVYSILYTVIKEGTND